MLTSDQLKVVSICQHRNKIKPNPNSFHSTMKLIGKVSIKDGICICHTSYIVLYCAVLQLPDAGAGLEDVEVLEDVRNCHQPQGSQEPQTNPVPDKSEDRERIIGKLFGL